MAEIVLYHHALGLTAGITAFAGRLRQAGHAVHLPDLYEGRVFDTVEEGLAHARRIGFEALRDRGVAAAEQLGGRLVYGGFSLGVVPAQQLAQTRPGAQGALLFHGALPFEEFSPVWPAEVPVQIHAKEADPFFAEEGGDIDAARALVDAAPQAELFLYPGEDHLFTDSSLPSYDAAASDLVIQRVLGFLAR